MGYQAVRNFNYAIISADGMSADVTSERINIMLNQAVSVQFTWSAGSTPIGVMSVEASIDGVAYVTLSTSALTGNSGTYIFNIEEPAYSFIRAKYARTSGSGSLTVTAAGKVY